MVMLGSPLGRAMGSGFLDAYYLVLFLVEGMLQKCGPAQHCGQAAVYGLFVFVGFVFDGEHIG